MRRIILALTLGILATPAQAEDCAFEGPPRETVERALTAWDRLDSRVQAAAPVRPVIQVFDLQCQYALTPSETGAFRVGARSFDVRAFAHGGTVAVGDGDPFPVGKTAFATNDEASGTPIFVIALPPVWAADTADRRDPDQLFMAVFMHEFSHVQHMAGLNPRFEALAASGYSAMNMGDDAVQRTFSGDPEFVAAWQAEMAAFTAAATAPDRETAMARLAEGRALMAQRRARWFSDPAHVGWAAADDVWLTMEGAGQWAGWSWKADSEGGGLSPEAALAGMRTRWWSQEEGMMIMLGLDKVTPDWPALTFGPQGLTIDDLLDRALGAAVEPS